MIKCEDCGEEVEEELEYYAGKDRCPRCIEKLVEHWEEG